MTENHSRDEQTKKKQEKVVNTLENSARWTVNKLNSVLGSVGIPKIDTDGLLEAIKAGTVAPNSIVGAAEEMLKIMAGTLKTISSAAKKVPFIGKVLAATIKLTGKSLVLASHLVDRVKDACVDLAVSNLAWQVGNLQDGLNDVKNKVDKQGKAMEEGFAKVKQALADAKSELKGDIEKQGKEFKEAMDEMDSMMNEFKSQTAQNLAHIEGEIEGLKIEQNRQASQLFDQKLEFGRLERELTDKMKNAEKNVEFARQELTEHREALNKAENRIDRSVKEGQHQWEEFQSEWQHRESILKNRVESFQDQVGDFQQEQMNVRREQDQINRNFAEMEEEFEQQGLLLNRHIDKVSQMVDDVEEITADMNKRMDRIQKSQLEQDEKIEEINYTVKKATKEVKERLEKQDKQIDNLTEQMKENQEKVKQAKAEADKANERIDNLITNQTLSDFSPSEQVFKKLEKVFEQKTEEAKLLTNLETLKKVRKEIPTVENEQEWLVGIQKGTESQLPRSEGYPLIIPQRWIKKYGWTTEELREWGWDVRMKGEHETAPLTDEERRQEQRTSEQQRTSDKPKEVTEQQEAYLQKIEDTKAEILSKLATIQEQINASVEQIETVKKREESEEELDDLEDQLSTKKFTQELGGGFSQVQQSLKSKWEEFKKQAQVATGTKKPVNQPEPKISETAQKMIRSVALQTEIEALEEQKKQAQEDYHAKKQEREQLEEFIETKKKEIESQAESGGEVGNKQAKESSEEVKDLEELLEQAKKEEAKLEQDIEKKEKEQQDKKEELEKTEPTKELEKELEKELQATQKTMTFVFLLIIIFLLEYIVYKRNGLPGLVVLNVILGIIYYHKDTLKEYWKYVDKYLLIIAYIMGNALAYHAVEKPQYKWTAVIVYNAIIAALFGYSWWQTNNISQKIKDKIDEFTAEQEKVLEQVQKEQEEFKKQEEEREVEETKQRLEALQKLEEISHSITKPTRIIQNNLEVNQKFLEMAEERQEGYTKVIKAFEEAIEELKKEEQLIDKNINSTQKAFLN